MVVNNVILYECKTKGCRCKVLVAGQRCYPTCSSMKVCSPDPSNPNHTALKQWCAVYAKCATTACTCCARCGDDNLQTCAASCTNDKPCSPIEIRHPRGNIKQYERQMRLAAIEQYEQHERLTASHNAQIQRQQSSYLEGSQRVSPDLSGENRQPSQRVSSDLSGKNRQPSEYIPTPYQQLSPNVNASHQLPTLPPQQLQLLSQSYSPVQSPIYFHDKDKPYYEFTNAYMSPTKQALFTDGRGIEYKSSEHYYQSHKFIPRSKIFTDILNADTPAMAISIVSENIKNIIPIPLNVENQIKRKINIMRTGLHLKFAQNPVLRALLLSTGDHPLIYTGKNKFWGDLKNNLGILLMQLRTELRTESRTDFRKDANTYIDKYQKYSTS